MQHHNYSYEDLMNMLPYEREIYIALLLQFLEEQKEQMQKASRR